MDPSNLSLPTEIEQVQENSDPTQIILKFTDD